MCKKNFVVGKWSLLQILKFRGQINWKMSGQKAGSNYEEWDSHNQWMEYDTFEEVGTPCDRSAWNSLFSRVGLQ